MNKENLEIILEKCDKNLLDRHYLTKEMVWGKLKQRVESELIENYQNNEPIIHYWDDLERFFKYTFKDITENELDNYINLCLENNYSYDYDTKVLFENGFFSDEKNEQYINDEKLKTEVFKKITELEKVKPEYTNFWNDLDNSLNDYHLNVYEIKNNIIFDENYSYWEWSDTYQYKTVIQLMKKMIINSNWCQIFSEII